MSTRALASRVGLSWIACCVALGCATQAARAPGSAPVATPTAVAAPQPSAPPSTEQRPVTDSYHGVRVSDPYRWLEDSKSEAVRAWTAAQNAYTREHLDALPDRAAIRARVQQLVGAPLPSYPGLRVAGGQWFVTIDQPPKQQRFLVVLPAGGAPSEARVIIDPNALDASGKTTIDWFEPSADGKRVAVSLSRAGTESGDLHLIDVASAKVSEIIPRVNGGTAGGHVAFSTDGKGVYYTRYPRAGERPEVDLDFYQQLYFHAFGTDTATDRYELGKDFPRIAEIRVFSNDSQGRVLVSMQKGDGGEFEHHLRDKAGKWRKVAGYEDKLVQIGFGPRGALYAITRIRSPRGELIEIDGKKLDLKKARVVYAPQDASMVSSFWDARTLALSDKRWYGTFQLGGPSEVRAFDYEGKPLPFSAPLPVASVRALMDDGRGGLLLRAQSFIDPAAWYRFDAASGAIEKTKLADASPADFSGYEVVREMAPSKDGTKVPVSILKPKGTPLDGSHAAVVTGYGGYGINLEPRFDAELGLWLEQGVIYAVANLRGGGEYGEAWHREGNLTKKQNVFDDFAGVLQHLIARGYTRSERLGIIGGSNGGLLMGATVVQHPSLVRAAVSFVGIYDSLRSELSPNGAFNVTEFGTVQDKAQFEALYAYSPYHHVVDGTAYPSLLLLTGENDPRVDPWHSRKMAARMQAANNGPRPTLLYINADAGHGGGSDLDLVIAETTDFVSFMLDALSVRVRAR